MRRDVQGLAGVSKRESLTHPPVNVAVRRVLPHLLHGEEECVWGDQAYRGQSEVIYRRAPQAGDCTHKRYRYKHRIDEVERAKNRTKRLCNPSPTHY